MTDAPNPSAAKTGEPVAWAYDLAMRYDHVFDTYDEWKACLSATKPNGPDGGIRNLTPLYTHPQPSLSVGLDREAIIEAVKDAMTDAWADICSDTGCWPADLKRVGKSPVRLEYRPAIWTESTAEMAANRILALAAPAEGYVLVPVEPTEAMMRAGRASDDQPSEGQDADLAANYRAMIAACLPAAPTGGRL